MGGTRKGPEGSYLEGSLESIWTFSLNEMILLSEGTSPSSPVESLGISLTEVSLDSMFVFQTLL